MGIQADWIRSKYSSGVTKDQLKMMYKVFVKETGSTAKYEAYTRMIRKACNSGKKKDKVFNKNDSISDIKLTKESIGPDITMVSTSSEIKTLEQLISYAKIDTDKYEITRHTINQWTTWSTRLGEKIPLENYQVKAWMSLKDEVLDSDKEELENLIETAKNYAPTYTFIQRNKQTSGNALEICLFDHHFGQLSWGSETGDRNYDVKIARDMAIGAVSDILNKAKHYNPEKIIIPIGNDWFNVNDKTNTTVKGTPQSEDERWQKTFVSGRMIWVEILELCRSVAPVLGLWVPGNHDEERSFHLCDSLYCWFYNSDIEIDHSPKSQKVIEWGRNAIMYSHGCNERMNDYPAVFATTFPQEFARAKYRAIHLGDKHHTKKSSFTANEDVYSIDVKIKPSLVPLNAWSSGKAYRAIARTEAEIWNKEECLVADLYCNM